MKITFKNIFGVVLLWLTISCCVNVIGCLVTDGNLYRYFEQLLITMGIIGTFMVAIALGVVSFLLTFNDL